MTQPDPMAEAYRAIIDSDMRMAAALTEAGIPEGGTVEDRLKLLVHRDRETFVELGSFMEHMLDESSTPQTIQDRALRVMAYIRRVSEESQRVVGAKVGREALEGQGSK